MSSATLTRPSRPERVCAQTAIREAEAVPSAPAADSRTVERDSCHRTVNPRRTRPARGAIGETRRPAGRSARPLAPTAPASSRCAEALGQRGRPPQVVPVYARRRATAVAILVGTALAIVVWVIGVVGNNYADSVSPAPAATHVVHVREGDSLSSIAARVAPELPSRTVIDEIVELNDLASSGLRVGQPLLTPDYR